MRTFTVAFFGHRVIKTPIIMEKQLEKIIIRLLQENEYVTFLVGRDGEFDQLVSSVIRRCKRSVRRDNSAHVWVLPYQTAELRDSEDYFRAYYDEIEICEASVETHFKNAYQTRNRSMIDRSDLVVFCIQHQNGGAWQTMKYAKKQGKLLININGFIEEAE